MKKSPSSQVGSDVISRIMLATRLIEEATGKVLSLTQEMQDAIDRLPESRERQELKSLIRKIYECCTFEDIASQHLTQIIQIIHAEKVKKTTRKSSLLNGPSCNPEEDFSQEEIDKLLKE